MTYFEFLLCFVVPPILVLTVFARPKARHWIGIGILAIITYVWTTPWDNYLVASGVWAYRPDQVSGLVLGYVPIEEYTFFGLQAILGSLWTLSLQRLTPVEGSDRPSRFTSLLAITLAWSLGPILAAVLGLASQIPTSDVVATHAWPPLPFGQANYLILILVWAVPVIIGQWVIGQSIFRKRFGVWALGWLVPTLYLSVSDSVAIAAGVWHILPTQSLGWLIPLGSAGLPFEEGVFFLVTSMLVTQGFVLVTAPQGAALTVETVRALLGRKGARHDHATPVSGQ